MDASRTRNKKKKSSNQANEQNTPNIYVNSFDEKKTTYFEKEKKRIVHCFYLCITNFWNIVEKFEFRMVKIYKYLWKIKVFRIWMRNLKVLWFTNKHACGFGFGFSHIRCMHVHIQIHTRNKSANHSKDTKTKYTHTSHSISADNERRRFFVWSLVMSRIHSYIQYTHSHIWHHFGIQPQSVRRRSFVPNETALFGLF